MVKLKDLFWLLIREHFSPSWWIKHCGTHDIRVMWYRLLSVLMPTHQEAQNTGPKQSLSRTLKPHPFRILGLHPCYPTTAGWILYFVGSATFPKQHCHQPGTKCSNRKPKKDIPVSDISSPVPVGSWPSLRAKHIEYKLKPLIVPQQLLKVQNPF